MRYLSPLSLVGGYWMLWISEEGFSLGMNVCNISSFVTLTLCTVVGSNMVLMP